MEVRQRRSKSFAVSSLLCLCLIATLCIAAQASSLLPWETEYSVKNALLKSVGTSIACEGVVDRISARNNPAFFVLRDSFASSRDTEISKVVVLCRPPASLGSGQSVFVEGTLGTLPGSNERCIYDPTVYGYFKNGKQQYWTPFLFLGMASGYERQVLPFSITAIPPSDPSIADNGLGISGEVTAFPTEGAAQFDTVASLLATDPAILTFVELSCKPIKEVGDGYIVVGDDNSDAVVKVFTNATVKPTDRLIKLTAVVHSENGRLVLYGGNGPSPYFDPQGVGGGLSVASVGTVAYAATLSDSGAAGEESQGGYSIMSVSSPTLPMAVGFI